jgi:hypothetical protein
VHATLTRDGTVYAAGMMAIGQTRSRALLSATRRLRDGRYKLTLRRGGRIIGHRTVFVS